MLSFVISNNYINIINVLEYKDWSILGIYNVFLIMNQFFPTKSIGNIDTIHSNLPSFNYFPNNGKSFTYALHTMIEPLSFSLKVHHLPALLSKKHKEVLALCFFF